MGGGAEEVDLYYELARQPVRVCVCVCMCVCVCVCVCAACRSRYAPSFVNLIMPVPCIWPWNISPS